MIEDFFEDYNVLKERAVKRIVEAYNFSQHLGMGKLYVAFSGGKDSVAVYGVCKLASEELGIELLDMCEFHYNITNVDPPELVQFIKRDYPFVERHLPNKTMWDLIATKKLPPTRVVRYCCSELKERGGENRFCVTGVRWAESKRRAKTRGAFENYKSGGAPKILFEDNEDDRRELEHCIPKRKYICNPIVDWSDEMVWEFIKLEKIPYCKLYDEGFKRLGCIGCPLASKKEREMEFERYPKYKDQYIRSFYRMLEDRRKNGLKTEWKTGEEVFEFWLNGGGEVKSIEEDTLFEGLKE